MSIEKVVEITRHELYQMVWSRPVIECAKSFGMSDVGLAKICKRHKVPRPYLGYWARIQAGQKPQKTPLPKSKDNSKIRIYVRTPVPKEKNASKMPFDNKSMPDIVVREVLSDPHYLIAETSKFLERCQYDNAGIAVLPKSGCLDIRVAKESLSRALKIMNALITSLEAIGFQVFIQENTTNVKILDVTVTFKMGEELDRQHLRAKDLNLDGYYQFGYNSYEKQPIHSGRLFLMIEDPDFYSHSEYRRNWRDTESKKLEDFLKSFVLGLIRIASMKKRKMDRDRAKEFPNDQSGSNI